MIIQLVIVVMKTRYDNNRIYGPNPTKSHFKFVTFALHAFR